jgi:hypothetical protein
MKHRSNERNGIKAAFADAVYSSVIIGVILTGLINSGIMDTVPTGAPGVVPAYADNAPDPAASAKAFLAAYPVYMDPRCVNCHPAGDAPLQGDESRTHAMRVKRGPGGMGKSAMQCSSCHQAANLPGAHMPPGGPGWQLPPEDMPMVFEKKTAHELCVQLKNPAQNGNRTPMEMVDHVRTAPLVLWGWNPGEGRKPVPMSHDTFVKYMTEWAEKGAACPD